jgi:hypothetical protein
MLGGRRMNPSVILSFRVKVDSPLYKWLEDQAGAAGSLSDVVRDIMEHHRLNKLDDAELYNLKRRAMLWTAIKEYAAPNLMDNFWAWYEKNS